MQINEKVKATEMPWITKVVGDFGDKKKWREYKARVKALPAGYREAANGLERYFMYFGPNEDGSLLIQLVTDFADLMEQSVADGTTVRQLVGEDPVEFAEQFLANYDGGSFVRKERARLAASIDKAVVEEGAS